MKNPLAVAARKLYRGLRPVLYKNRNQKVIRALVRLNPRDNEEKLYEEYYSKRTNIEKGEKYIAPLYNYLIQKGKEVRISVIDVEKIHVLGTPEELDYFKEHYKR